jgi:hypothetical protein
VIKFPLGKIAYEAYRKDSGGKSLISGQPIPAFDILPEAIQHAWSEAAHAAAEEILNMKREKV